MKACFEFLFQIFQSQIRGKRYQIMSTDVFYDRADIQKILPHRSPFLFVDRVIHFRAGKDIIAEKDLLSGEPFFAGHFPGRPIVPGVLISEALAQTSGLLVGLSRRETAGSDEHARMNLVLASVNIKFFTPVKPGDTLRLEATLQKEYGGLYLFKVDASVGGNPAAGGTVTLAEEA
jgi:3-hydroxyacyl-[acyl-carrier-protein] dehydratase